VNNFGLACWRTLSLVFLHLIRYVTVTTLYDSATMYDLLRCFGFSDDLFNDDYFRCVPNKEKVLWTPAFLWGIDVMIKKSRSGLALRLDLAGPSSEGIYDK
jgi:hypothetical protein